MTMGGLGTAAQQTFAIKSEVVAMMVIFNHSYTLGWAPVTHILSARIPNTRCRDMTHMGALRYFTLLLNSTFDRPSIPSLIYSIPRFAVTFLIPYLLNAPYADLKSKVSFIFGSTTAISIVSA